MHHTPGLAALAGANQSRSRSAADARVRSVRAALKELGPDAPARYAEAGLLRLAYPTVSLRQLGAYADPPVSKDTIAALLRRLVVLAAERRRGTA